MQFFLLFSQNSLMKKNKFVQGILLLGGIGIVSKIIGAVYRVPLTNLLGSEGMGLYQMVFPIFSFLIAISSSGFPASISKLVAQYNSRGDHNIGGKILSLSRQSRCKNIIFCNFTCDHDCGTHCRISWVFSGF